MSKRLSEFYGMDVYTQKAMYVGKVEDVILNLDKGDIMRLSFKPFRGTTLSSEEVKTILQSETTPYDDVMEVGDVIIIQKAPLTTKQK